MILMIFSPEISWFRNEKKGPQRLNSKEPIPEPVEVQ